MTWLSLPRCDNPDCNRVLDRTLVCGENDTLFCSQRCRMQFKFNTDPLERTLQTYMRTRQKARHDA